MEIIKNKKGEELTISLVGRLDTNTAPELETAFKASVEGVKNLVFDFAKLEYISSAGLRVLLGAQKTMNEQGEMSVINANDEIKEVFDITGFSSILTVK